MNANFAVTSSHQTTARLWSGAVFSLGLLLSLAACTSTGRHLSGWSGMTIRPGDTVTCQSNPCEVYFEMPPGSGTYRLTGTGFTIGEYPAGETVLIGGIFDNTAIHVQGADVPPAFVYVPSSSAQ